MRTPFPSPPNGAGARQPVPPSVSGAPAAFTDGGLRRAGLTIGLALLFVRVSFLHQIITYETGINSRLLYILGIPTLLATFGSGTLKRTFGGSIGFGWIGFVGWMCVATVFSSWPGGSADLTITYIRTTLPMLAVAGGFAVFWKDCERTMSWVAAAGVVNAISTKIFQHDDSGRLSMDFGTVSNSNDLAAHLLFVLPFLVYVVLKKGSNFLFRVVCAASAAWTLYTILGTASRGALLALAAVALVSFLTCNMTQRLGLIALLVVAGLALISALPPETLRRITSFSSSSSTADQEALASSAARQYLLEQGVKFTLQHPVMGVGPGQFSEAVGLLGRTVGMHVWQETHNFFTQIGSECGIPALLFYLTAVVSSVVRLVRTLRKAGRRPEFARVRWMTLCILISVTGYGVSSLFLNLAYQLYWPVLSGMAVSTARAAEAEFFAVPGAEAIGNRILT